MELLELEYKMKGEPTFRKSDKEKHTTHKKTMLTVPDKRKHEITLVITSLGMVFVWLIIILVLAKFTLTDNILLNVIFVITPPIVIVYHGFTQYFLVEESKTVEEESEKIIEEMENEKEFAKIIPSVVFGLGILLSKFSEHIYLMLPYLVLVIIFGTLVPYFALFVNFTDSNIIKLIISETLEYSSEAFAFAYFIPAFFLLFRGILDSHKNVRDNVRALSK